GALVCCIRAASGLSSFPAMPDPADTTTFGFSDVPAEAKAPLVRRVFDSVADRYDLMNDLMSGGIHRWWKSELVAEIAPRPGQTELDVAGGTGDVANALLAAAPGARVVICDVNEQMVRRGRDRALDDGRLPGLERSGLGLVVGDAERLPVADASADTYVIAFGLRNVTRLD